MGNEEMQRATGFTLIEMLVVVALGAILLAVGVPSFTFMLDRNRVSSEVNEMLADLSLTRSEAISRRGRVVLCRSNNPRSATPFCDGAATDWNSGWIIFVDDPAAATAFQRDDPNEPVVRAYLRGTTDVTLTATPALAGVVFTSDGSVFGLDGLPLGVTPEPVRIDFGGKDASNSRSLCIATTGRVRLSTSFGNCL